MAYLHYYLEKKFGKNYDLSSKEVIDTTVEFYKEFNKRYPINEEGIQISGRSTQVSFLDFMEGMEINFKNLDYIVESIIIEEEDTDQDRVVLKNKTSGEQLIIYNNELRTEYYWDDFFTRLDDTKLEELGFIRQQISSSIDKNKSPNTGENKTVKLWDFVKDDIVRGIDFYCAVLYEITIISEEVTLNSILTSSGEEANVKTIDKLYEFSFICGPVFDVYTKCRFGVEHIKHLLRQSLEQYYPLEMEVKDEDILITDPCYILDEDYGIELHKRKLIYCNTIYGDWSCTTYDSDTKEVLGLFCADSGQVCVLRRSDFESIQGADWEKKLEKLHKGCYTLIKNFTGKVYIEYDFFGNCTEQREGEVSVVGKGNINFKTAQTGF